MSAITPVAGADRHFATDHLLADLKVRTIRGGALTVGGQGAKFIVQLGSTAVLARMLTPADFGLIAMVVTVTGFAALFRDLGLSNATIQQRTISHEQVSTLFWINIAAGVGLALAVAALAPVVAWFYGVAELRDVTIVLGFSFVLGSLAAQHTALLRRQMRYWDLTVIEVIALLSGVVAAIVVAVFGFGFWALVALTLVQAFVMAIGAWLACRWVPGRPRYGSGVGPMLRFGGNLTGFNVLNYLTRNFDNVLAGVVLGAGPLGIYSKAYNLLLMPIRQINTPMGAVAMPALSRLQDRPADFRRFYLKAIGIVAFLGMPIAVFFATATIEVVLVLLGSQWIEVVPVFRALAPAAFAGAMNVAPGWLCNALGLTHRQLHWALLAAPVTVGAFSIGIAWGILGLAVAFSVTWTALLVIFIWYACRGTPVGLSDFARVCWRPAIAALAAGCAVLGLLDLTEGSAPWMRLVLAGATFTAVYLLSWIALPGGKHLLIDYAGYLSHLRWRRT